MAYKVKYEHPGFPKDAEFEIPLLGLVKNGGTLEVTPEAEQAFVNERGMSLKEAFADDEMITLEGSATAKVPETPTETTTESEPEKEDKAGEK